MNTFTSTRSGILRLIYNPLFISSYSTKRAWPSQNSSNELLKTLNSRDDYERAFHFFDNLVKQNKVTIKSLLTILDTCTRSVQIDRARQIEKFINQSHSWKNHLRLQTSLINMYMKFQMIDQAERIFERIRHLSECDIIVYNSMLKGYLRNHKVEQCFSCIEKLGGKLSPDNVTYILLLNACTILRDKQRGKLLHNALLSTLDIQHVHLQNALIDFYGKINEINSAEKIFHEMILRETSTYNSLMKAYLINHIPLKVLELFEQMKENNRNSLGPLAFRPDLITFMAVCDACEQLGLLKSPDSFYEEYDWKKIFSRKLMIKK